MFSGMRRTHVAIVGVVPTPDVPAPPEQPRRRGPATSSRWFWTSPFAGHGSATGSSAAAQDPPVEAVDDIRPAPGTAGDAPAPAPGAGAGADAAVGAGAGAGSAAGAAVGGAAGPAEGEAEEPRALEVTSAVSTTDDTPYNSLRDAEGNPIALGYPAEVEGAETAAESANRGPVGQCLDAVLRCLGLRSSEGSQTRPLYPTRFKALVAVVVGLSLLWLGNYLFVVMPTIEQYHGDCEYNDSQLRYNAKILFVYFAWFICARLSLFLPCVATRVIWVQSRTHGFCHAYCVHLLLRDGPLYIFVMGSLLFWFHLMQSPICEQNSPDFYRALKLYAIYSNLVSIFCLILAHWHNKLLADAAGITLEREMGQSAPPDTVHKLETHPYDEAVFGDEEGKLYPSECAICLQSWEQEDSIKVTPCGHAFHEECIGNWLQTARTCALCRQDLAAMTAVTPPADLRANRSAEAPAATVLGSPIGTAGEEVEGRQLPGAAGLEDV